MEIKLKTILEAKDALKQILTYPMDFKLAYQLRKLADQLHTEIKHIESTTFDMYKKYGKKVEGTMNDYRLLPENFEKFNKEQEEFLSLPTKVDIKKIPISYFEGLKISPMDMSLLEEFVEDVKAPTTPPAKRKIPNPVHP